MMVTTHSTISVPPLTAPTSCSLLSGTIQQGPEHKKLRVSNARCPPRPPASKNKNSLSLGAPTISRASPVILLSDDVCLLHESKHLGGNEFESPSDVLKRDDKTRHFLQGINFENCIDVLSIPDPPTPKTTEKLRRKRRQSSPFIMESLSLGENDGNFQAFIVSKATNSRSRRSLCHLSTSNDSPDWELHEVSRNTDFENSTSIRKQCDTELRDVTNKILDQNMDNPSSSNKYDKNVPRSAVNSDNLKTLSASFDHNKHHCNKKKRESNVIPFGIQSDEASEKNISLNNPTKEALDALNTDSQIPCLTQGTSKLDWAQIRSLVRKYTSLSPASRSVSQDALAIEMMTGYPLVPPSQRKTSKASVDLNWTSSPGNMKQVDSQRRMLFMQKIGPNMQKLEKLKYQEEKEVEIRTNARVQKVKAKYHYYDLSTGSRIAPDQYRQRYMTMLYENVAFEDSKATDWLATLSSCNVIPFVGTKDQGTMSLRKQRIGEDGTDCYASDNEGCGIKSSNTVELGIADAEEESNDLVSCSTIASPLILPLPDRDEESADPDIALAERRLWAALDSALDSYSKEVIQILKAKGGLFPSVESD